MPNSTAQVDAAFIKWSGAGKMQPLLRCWDGIRTRRAISFLDICVFFERFFDVADIGAVAEIFMG